jgi:hypothetical protein
MKRPLCLPLSDTLKQTSRQEVAIRTIQLHLLLQMTKLTLVQSHDLPGSSSSSAHVFRSSASRLCLLQLSRPGPWHKIIVPSRAKTLFGFLSPSSPLLAGSEEALLNVQRIQLPRGFGWRAGVLCESCPLQRRMGCAKPTP